MTECTNVDLPWRAEVVTQRQRSCASALYPRKQLSWHKAVFVYPLSSMPFLPYQGNSQTKENIWLTHLCMSGLRWGPKSPEHFKSRPLGTSLIFKKVQNFFIFIPQWFCCLCLPQEYWDLLRNLSCPYPHCCCTTF